MCLHPKLSPITQTHRDHYFDFSTGFLDCDSISCDYVESSEKEKHPSALRILQLNTRGILSKQDELRQLLINNSIDIALICETWLTSNNEDRLDVIGYKYIGKTRSGRKGGGVCILVKDYLIHRPVGNLLIDPIDLEYCANEIKTDSGTLLVCSAYRPPNMNPKLFLDDYKKLTSGLNKIKNRGIIIGLDHNLDLLKHSTHSSTQEFLDMNLDAGLLPCITKPTRITKSTATLIDNIFAKCTLKINQSLVIYDDISDHLPCLIECDDLMNSAPDENMTWKRQFEKKTWIA